MRKPALTDKVLKGIITATTNLMAGDISSAFGQETPETRKAWDAMRSACEWAGKMQAWKREKNQERPCPFLKEHYGNGR